MPSQAVKESLVESKAIKDVSTLQARERRVRLDIGPFHASYLGGGVYGLVLASQGRWDDVYILSYSAAGLIAIQILLKLFMHWNVDVQALAAYTKTSMLTRATHLKVVPSEFAGDKEIVPIQRRQLTDGSIEVAFEYRKQRLIYNGERRLFEELKYPVQEPYQWYHSQKGFTKEAHLKTAQEIYGDNTFSVPIPQFLQLLKEQCLAPFFVFQVFCVGLWCLDEYWYYSIFTLGMLVMFESTVVGQRLRSLKELRSLQTPKQEVHVYRFGKWHQVPGDQLLPGDIISIGRPSGPGGEDLVVPADCALLAGGCIADEAILTGESTPQWKAPLPEHGDSAATMTLRIKRDKRHVIFGGTKLLQHSADKAAKLRTPDGGCLAIVLRTSFETEQGRLMRTILHSTERVTANNWETGLFILFLLIFAVAASIYVLRKGLGDPERSRFKLYLNCVMIITSVIPPELPMELSIAVNQSLMALARKMVFCTEPFRIPWAGKVTVCCFDKTGTLTSDDILLEGLALPNSTEAVVAPLLKQAQYLPQQVQRVFAGCQSLVTVEGSLVGDPLEKAAMVATGFLRTVVRKVVGSIVTVVHLAGVDAAVSLCVDLPAGWKVAGSTVSSPAGKPKETITVLHRFAFSSALKRMAAIVRVEAEGSSNLYVVAKGAPEVMEELLDPLPLGYKPTYKHYAAEGARVLCLAYKELSSSMTADELRGIAREEAERGLQLAGCAIFQTPLKADSEPALRMLADSSHQLVMITGDAALTACHVAAQVHIVTRPVLILTHLGHSQRSSNMSHALPSVIEPDNHYQWASPDEKVTLPFSRDWGDIYGMAAEYDLCLTGDALTHIQQLHLEALFVPLTQVFARVSPEQKELILRTLRAAGGVTLMCGDGTNDVGALKAAHVGIALLHASHAPKNKDGKAKADKKPDAAATPAVANGSSNGPTAGPQALAKRGPPGPSSGRPGMPQKKSHAAALAHQIEELKRQGRPVPKALERMHEWAEAMEEQEQTMVKPGDASMAAPFTAKQDSVMPCTEIIKQGRSTLVTMVQMFKILGLLCLSSAYSLSVMYHDGVRLGDVQATIQGFLNAGLFFCLSNAKPLQRLSAERPHPNIFSIYLFASLMGQFACHITFLIAMYQRAIALMDPAERLPSDTEFKPNLVNTVCYLIQFSLQIMTFGVNYVGHPFNTSIAENKGLFNVLRWSAVFYCALVLDPLGVRCAMLAVLHHARTVIGESMSLVPIPEQLRMEMVMGAIACFVLTLSWEHLLRKWFPAKRPPAKGYQMFSARQQPKKLKSA